MRSILSSEAMAHKVVSASCASFVWFSALRACAGCDGVIGLDTGTLGHYKQR